MGFSCRALDVTRQIRSIARRSPRLLPPMPTGAPTRAALLLLLIQLGIASARGEAATPLVVNTPLDRQTLRLDEEVARRAARGGPRQCMMQRARRGPITAGNMVGCTPVLRRRCRTTSHAPPPAQQRA
jgi:hypothetical protein